MRDGTPPYNLKQRKKREHAEHIGMKPKDFFEMVCFFKKGKNSFFFKIEMIISVIR